MIKQLQSQLTQATISTFENLGFVMAEPTVADFQAEQPLAWGARVDFRGPVSGWFDVRLTDDVVDEVAANMLGLDGNVPDDDKRDAVGEIANVICGNVVPALGAPEDVFDLSAPHLSTVDVGVEHHEGTMKFEFGISGGRAELELMVEVPVAEEAAT